MSRMKHLLRKLHLAGAPAGGGGAAPGHHRPRHRRSGHPTPTPSVVIAAGAPEPPQPAVTPAAVSLSVAPAAAEEPRGLGAEAATMWLEEDYQVRLALAISASDHAGLVDADSVQIRAAELISLGAAAVAGAGCGPHDRSRPAEALSARYWNHSVVNYDEHLPDGFYDVCGAQLHPGFQAKFPSLDYLRAVPPGRDVPFLAILVDRTAAIAAAASGHRGATTTASAPTVELCQPLPRPNGEKSERGATLARRRRADRRSGAPLWMSGSSAPRRRIREGALRMRGASASRRRIREWAMRSGAPRSRKW